MTQQTATKSSDFAKREIIGEYTDFANNGKYTPLIEYLKSEGKEVEPHRFASYAEYTDDLVYTQHQTRESQDAYDRKVRVEWYGPSADSILDT